MNWEKQKRFLNFVTKVGFLIVPISIIGSIIGFNIGDGNFMMIFFLAV